MKQLDNLTRAGLCGIALATLLTACGGGGSSSSDSSSPSIVTRGKITALGSIWVNGVEYETPNGGSYKNDDSSSTSANFKVGQVVSLRGTHSGRSGTTKDVTYEAELEGEADSKTTINQITVLIGDSTNKAEATLTGNDLNIGSRYEVSGFWIDSTTIEATYIKNDDDGDSEDEIKGLVEAVNPGIDLTVRSITFSYAGPTVVAVGDYVEVHFNGTTANEVQLEDDYFDDMDDGEEVEIEGAVNLSTAGCPPDADIMVADVCINLGSVEEWEDGLNGAADLTSGLRVEVEGYYSAAGDYLVAEEVKGRNQMRVFSTASDLGVDTFNLFGGVIQVETSSSTQFDTVNNLFSDIANSDILEVHGVRTGPTSMLALRVKEKSSIGDDEHEVRAEVDLNGADSGSNGLTVMGITATLDAETKLKIEDVIVAPGDGVSPDETAIDGYLDDSMDDDNLAGNGPRDIVQLRVRSFAAGPDFIADQIEIEYEDD
jgi:hypothetical protein